MGTTAMFCSFYMVHGLLRRLAADNNTLINSLTTAPVVLDVNNGHGLLGHPDTRTVMALVTKHV
jgi:hypothetical protein